jgi:ribonucleoside-diphosphate reductase beta chain
MAFTAVDWNNLKDQLDLDVWNRMTGNFWLPEKIPLSNDLPSWSTVPREEQLALERAFAGLTVLDTIQSEVGAHAVGTYAHSHHEEACMAFIGGMEAIHARSYSSIFTTLNSTEQIEAAFEFAHTNANLQAQARSIVEYYKSHTGDLESREFFCRTASVFLESFLFYSGFYPALRLCTEGKCTNTADIIRLIMRDEGIHGFYIGLRAKALFDTLPQDRQELLAGRALLFVRKLYELQVDYVHDLYADTTWEEDALKYSAYNANKALTNLGLPVEFKPKEVDVSPAILAQMTLETNETHDFFSGSGSSYILAKTEELSDDDWS